MDIIDVVVASVQVYFIVDSYLDPIETAKHESLVKKDRASGGPRVVGWVIAGVVGSSYGLFVQNWYFFWVGLFMFVAAHAVGLLMRLAENSRR